MPVLAGAMLAATMTGGFDPGPKVGESLPAFEAVDQSGRTRDFASLRGPKGLALLVFRSADW